MLEMIVKKVLLFQTGTFTLPLDTGTQQQNLVMETKLQMVSDCRHIPSPDQTLKGRMHQLDQWKGQDPSVSLMFHHIKMEDQEHFPGIGILISKNSQTMLFPSAEKL